MMQPLDPLLLADVAFRGIRSRRLGELTLLRMDKGKRVMNVEKLKRQTEELRRDTERLQAKDRPDPVKLLRLQRRADEIRKRVRRAEELQKMRDQLKEA